jgi:hypothetical protein
MHVRRLAIWIAADGESLLDIGIDPNAVIQAYSKITCGVLEGAAAVLLCPANTNVSGFSAHVEIAIDEPFINRTQLWRGAKYIHVIKVIAETKDRREEI